MARMEMFLEPVRHTAQTLVPAAVVFVLLAIVTKREKVVEAWRRCRKESLTNIGIFIVNYILLVPLFLIPVIAVHETLPTHPLLEGAWGYVPEILNVVIAILLIDFAAYWRHRLEHTKPMWRFHATHHADEQITWFTVLRKHPVARLLSMIVDNIPLLILGAPIYAIVLANLARTWWGYFIHADVPWTLGQSGKLLMSPAAHRLHHIRDEELMGSNYGNTITLWDRLFGTYVDPKPYLNCETGIAEGTRGFWGELARPWEKRYRGGGEANVAARVS